MDCYFITSCMDCYFITSSPFLRNPFPRTPPPSLSHLPTPPKCVAPSATTTPSNTLSLNKQLSAALKDRQTDKAWTSYQQFIDAELPSSTCLSRLVCQLAYQGTPLALTRAHSILRRLRKQQLVHRLDANALGLLAMATAKAGHPTPALSIIYSMLSIGHLPHVKAWSAVLSRLSTPRDALKLFHSILEHLSLSPEPALLSLSYPDVAAFNAVLNACANAGDAVNFVEIFSRMPKFELIPDALTYNIMIKFFARIERKELLVAVLEKMLAMKVAPCATSFHSLVAAYVGLGDLEMAEILVRAMSEGRQDVCALLRERSPRTTAMEFDEISSMIESLGLDISHDSSSAPLLLPKSYHPDSRIYTTLMKGYMHQGRLNDVMDLLETMEKQRDSSQPDEVTYTTVVTALVREGLMDRARAMLSEMASRKVPANRVTYNVLLKGYCRVVQMKKAEALVGDMKEAGIELDVVSYNILIDGCIVIDDSAKALSYFNEMRSKGIAPSKISYTTLMKAFASSGKPKLASKVFDEMLKDPRVEVDMVAWNMLLDAYCRLGLFEEAKSIVLRIKESGMVPDLATYGSLANAIATARKPGEALLLWNEIKERCKDGGGEGPPPLKPDEGLLNTLADICVRSAFFKKALEIVVCMEENGIAPNKTKFKRIYVEMHSRMFTSQHASKARRDRRSERKRAAEAFKFWLGLPNSYYGSEWRLEQFNGNVNEGDD
ncbi:hypothetical protein AMTRI_Chr08g164940 [Amborella trichopoda]